MIYLNPQKDQFHLFCPAFSYVLGLKDGRLVNLYWGKPLALSMEEAQKVDLSYLFDLYPQGASFEQPKQRLPLEIPTEGLGWYGTPAVRAVSADGTGLTVLTYHDSRILLHKQPLEGLPSLHVTDAQTEPSKAGGALGSLSMYEDETLEIDLIDPLTGLLVTASYTIYAHDSSLTKPSFALAKSLRLKNTSSEKLLLTNMTSSVSAIDLTSNNEEPLEVIHLKGAWARERRLVRTPLGEGTYRFGSARGASGHAENPFVALTRPSTTEFSGEVWSACLIYSGSFEAMCQIPDDSSFCLMSLGLDPQSANWTLLPGKTFTTPEAVLVYSDDGLNGLSHIYHDLFRHCLGSSRFLHRDRPVLINSWEAAYFQIDEKTALAFTKEAAKLGVELFVLDDGWFAHRTTDTCSLGDWYTNLEKFPDDIRGLAEKVEAMGLKFGIWFEPEMISPDSDLYRAHPDWCLHVPGRERTLGRHQLILDLARPEVQDYIIGFMKHHLSSAPISYVKWDMNRNMTEAFSSALSPDRQSETQHRYILGLYRILEEITTAFPEVLFESCAGGGGRFDAGMLAYMPQTWTSDDSDARERLKIQYATSLVYPAGSMASHISAVPNHQTGRVTPMKTRAAVALSGNFGLELDLLNLSKEDKQIAAKNIALAKELRTLTREGVFDRLISPGGKGTYGQSAFGSGNYTAWQFRSERDVLVYAFRILSEPNPLPIRLKLTGLDPSALYSDGSKTYRGCVLMNAGLPISFLAEDFASVQILLKKQ